MIVYVGSIPYIVNDVSHSGILGMIHGKRRFRNYDGTLTEEGKIRYGRKKKQHPVKELSDDDLVKKTQRLRNENAYLQEQSRNNELTAPAWKKMVKKGVKIAGKVLGASGDILVKTISGVASFTAKELLSDLKDNADKARQKANKKKGQKPKDDDDDDDNDDDDDDDDHKQRGGQHSQPWERTRSMGFDYESIGRDWMHNTSGLNEEDERRRPRKQRLLG